ncbi:MAG: tetraacyldisaccharide 4'-kinase [Planctomycetota bacterium]|nr:tetraacyldisaccharide 4'-kinase [Planctomycetota bacterium]
MIKIGQRTVNVAAAEPCAEVEGWSAARGCEHGAVAITTQRAESLLAGPMALLAVIPWMLYRPLVRARNLLFDWGLRRQRQAGVPVVSIGNISLGGTGKTPLVALVCAELAALGHQPQVLSRGYKGDGQGNDEAAMLDWPVVCDPQRIRGAKRARAAGASCLVLDDGFQHRQIHRNLDIVAIDATRPWGRSDGRRGRTVPLGLLREHPSALSRANLLVLTRCDQVSEQRRDKLLSLLAKLGTGGTPVVCCAHAPSALCHLNGEKAGTPEDLAGQSVVAACGIGNPNAFTRTLRDLGAEIVAEHHFADHHHFTSAQCQALIAATPADALVLITAKDAVKWRALISGAEAERVRVLEVSAQMPADDLAVLRRQLQALAPKA